MGMLTCDLARQHTGRERHCTALHQQAREPCRAATEAQFAEALERRCAAAGRLQCPGHQLRRCDGTGGGAQCRASSIHKATQRGFAEPKIACHPLMGMSLYGSAQQRLTLHRWKRGQPGERLAYGYPPVQVRLRGIGSVEALVGLASGRSSLATAA